MDIYQYAQENVEQNERHQFIVDRFKLVMMNMKRTIVSPEMNVRTQPMAYVFEHIKDNIIDLVALFVESSKKEKLLEKRWTDIAYRKELLDVLVSLEYRPIILWIFLYTNYYNHKDLDVQRKQLLENMELLSRFYPRKLYFESVDDLWNTCQTTNLLFSISYQNRNNKNILERYSQLMRQLCPSLTYDCVSGRTHPVNKKIRVLFLSEFLAMDSSVLRDRMGIMVKMPKDKFDIYYASYKESDKIVGNVSKYVNELMRDKYICLTANFQENRNLISRYNFDIIVYCELGMAMKPYWLSYSRLAPVQITTWGHSETSGINTIDYYISSKYFEHEKAQNHYSEKLIMMDSLSTYYFPPSQILVSNYKYLSRKELNLDDSINIYGCIQSSFKISREFETMLYYILDRDPNGYILMSHYKPFCKSQMERIFGTFGEEKFRRLLFYPGLDINRYLNLVKLTDVMLDPYPFGGCNTSYESFDFDVPVVTMPTRFLNGRFTFGLYKKMGFIDMIATTAENYVKIAVRCANDIEWRNMIVDKIRRGKHLIFMEDESVRDWKNMLEDKFNSIHGLNVQEPVTVPDLNSIGESMENMVTSEDVLNGNIETTKNKMDKLLEEPSSMVDDTNQNIELEV